MDTEQMTLFAHHEMEIDSMTNGERDGKSNRRLQLRKLERLEVSHSQHQKKSTES